MLIKKWISFGSIFLMLLACSGKTKPSNPVNEIIDSAGCITGVRLSGKDAEQAGIRFGTFTREVHEKIVVCRGNLASVPGDKTYLVAPAGGQIVSVNCHPGQYLTAGSLVACIENSDFINLQLEYLEMKNQLEYLHEEYSRQGELAVENATSMKKMQLAKRDFQSVELKLKSLQLQLETIGIDPDSLNKTNITSVIQVLVPESGIVARVPVTRGMFANKGELLIELLKTGNVAARLKVPETYATRLKSSQPVEIFTASDSLTPIHVKISSVSREIDPAEQCAIVYVNMPGKNHIPGMSVTAKLHLGADSINLISSNSLLSDNSRYYLFVKKSGVIRKVPVQKGSIFDQLSEIKNTGDERIDSIVVEGIDYLNKYFTAQ